MPRTIDIIILLACIITIAIAFYDISKLNQIQDKAINKCNVFWTEQVKEKCPFLFQEEQKNPYYTIDWNETKIN